MKLSVKELDALRFCVERSELGVVEVEPFRDASDLGWLRARIIVKKDPGTKRKIGAERYLRISPLGHVYEGAKRIRTGPDILAGAQKAS